MYYRPQGYRYPQEMNLPSNYGGNAFQKIEPYPDEKDEEESAAQELDAEVTRKESEIESNKASEASEKNEKPVSLLGGIKQGSFLGGRIGSEELLIIAIIFLLSDADGSNDIVWLLLLLLFIK
ncbi:MAG: hypothetical protein IJD73_00260 [Clostridia bacterium]|nr:hypothetical protein [Clostridia bacterium]